MESISLKLIFRSWWRNKTFAVISLLSLAAGITCTNLLISYVIYESRIEAHNPNKSHIIYMAQDSPLTSGEKVSFIKGKIPVQLKDQYPEVEDYLRLNIDNAASMEYARIGFPQKSLIFFFGIRLLPPLAVIIANLLIFLTSSFSCPMAALQARSFHTNCRIL